MIKKIILCVFFILFYSKTHSQTSLNLYGKVAADSTRLLSNVNIILKTQSDSIIQFTTSDHNGTFHLTTTNSAKKFVLELRLLGYQKKTIVINASRDRLDIHAILLPSDNFLQEVTVQAKKPSIKINHDTTTYKVSKFLTGNEQVVEDVLKKLPGIEVSENGKITFKGKAISKVLIEGDDLFSNNYQVGTRNIKSVIVDELQAIENYNSNSKMAGMSRSDETVLNLKIKSEVKNKPTLSAEGGYGYDNKYRVGANLIGISKAQKYFVQGSANNIGENPTPYEYYSFKNNTPEVTDIADYQQKLITIYYDLPALKPQRGFLNNTRFGSGNAIFKPSKRVSVTMNYNLYADDLEFIKTGTTQFTNIQDSIYLSESEQTVKKPLIGNGYLKVLLDISKKTDLTFTTNYAAENIRNNNNLNSNYGIYRSSLHDDNQFIEEKITLSSRVSTRSALDLNLRLYSGHQRQDFTVTPGLSIIDSSLTQSTQLLSSKINGLEIAANFLTKSKMISQIFNIQFSHKMNNILSSLNESDTNLDELDNNLSLSYSNTLVVGKWKIAGLLAYKFKESTINNHFSSTLENQLSYLSPGITLEYKFNEFDKISSSFSYDKSVPSAYTLFPNYILTDTRTLYSGAYIPNNTKTKSLVTTYIHADLFNQLIYYLNFIYLKNTGTYGLAQTINLNYSLNEKIIVPSSNNYIFTTNVSKFIPVFLSTFKYTGSYSWYSFYNKIGTTPLRQNLTFNNTQRIEVKSGFSNWFNFETGIKYLYNSYKVTSLDVKNNNQNLQSYFNVLIKPAKNCFLSIINEHYYNNLESENSSSDYLFTDISFRYAAKRINYKIAGNNLWNNKVYRTSITNQISTSSQDYNLMPANLLLQIEFRF